MGILRLQSERSVYGYVKIIMKNICFYFQVHQPMRLRPYRFFDIGTKHDYFDDKVNHEIMRKVAEKCYLPTNQLLLELIEQHQGHFRISFSISGVCLDQFERFAPDVLESFQKLAATGCVEFLAETYSHSLSALMSPEEFKKQVSWQSQRIKDLFGKKPTTFRNTELIYSNDIGKLVEEMGYELMLTEGADHVLGWKSPNFMYEHAEGKGLKLLLKNYKLSDDIAFRFSQESWAEWPLTAEKFVDWVAATPWNQEIINLFMDYETFGEHQWEDSGIFEFLKVLPSQVLGNSEFKFVTPSETLEFMKPVAKLDVPNAMSWADEERDLTAWLGNPIQDDAFEYLYKLEEKVKQIDDFKIGQDWLYLQTSDHFYYMCTKFWNDGDVHKYFSHYDSPYEAFLNYMNVLVDFEEELNKRLGTTESTVYREKFSTRFKELLPESHQS